jgi:hypothetical protein
MWLCILMFNHPESIIFNLLLFLPFGFPI